MSEDTPDRLLAPLDYFTENMKELKVLNAVFSHVIDNPLSDPVGKPYNIEIMIKNGIVFIVTCWDEFIRDLITVSFDFMINNALDPDSFSVNVKMTASENLRPPKPSNKESDKEMKKQLSKRENWHDKRWKEDIWKLAGNGWKEILKESKNKVLNRYIDRFNTPRPDIIDKLFLNVIGLKKLSSNWKWKDMTEENSKDCLNILMNLRGGMAHASPKSKE